jgi:hypothetical protein
MIFFVEFYCIHFQHLDLQKIYSTFQAMESCDFFYVIIQENRIQAFKGSVLLFQYPKLSDVFVLASLREI